MAMEATKTESPFEAAVEAVIAGDVATLKSLLQQDPTLVAARSSRKHKATLLHYVAANGVEDERQKTPTNAVEVAKVLLDAGAEVDALAETYGGGSAQTTLALLVSSVHPARAGVQADLVKVLCDAGAKMDGVDNDGVPLATALAFMYPKAAEMLIQCGANVDNLIFAAAGGRLDIVQSCLNEDGTMKADTPVCPVPWLKASQDPRVAVEQAFVYACLCGQIAIADFLLQKGVNINARPKPDFGNPTALHLSAWGGQKEMVEFLVKRGADVNIRDDQYHAKPAGWAAEAGHEDIKNYLVRAGR